MCPSSQVEITGGQFSYWYLSDDVPESNWGAFSSEHQETFGVPNHCHLHLGVLGVPTVIPPAIPAVLAASVLLRVSPCGQHNHNYDQRYVSESLHSCHNSEQVFQGEEELCLDVESWRCFSVSCAWILILLCSTTKRLSSFLALCKDALTMHKWNSVITG
jgi:hypothetical protein